MQIVGGTVAGPTLTREHLLPTHLPGTLVLPADHASPALINALAALLEGALLLPTPGPRHATWG